MGTQNAACARQIRDALLENVSNTNNTFRACWMKILWYSKNVTKIIICFKGYPGTPGAKGSRGEIGKPGQDGSPGKDGKIGEVFSNE
jgi:hypothetical protein